MTLWQVVLEAAQDAKEQAALEKEEIEALTGGKQPMKVQPIAPEEIEAAQQLWSEKNKDQHELYDRDLILTSVESRLEALRSRGFVMLLADKQQTKAIVKAAKDIKSKVETDIAQKKAAEQAEADAARAKQQEEEKKSKKEQAEAEAKAKAVKFMRKMSGNL